MTPERNKRYKEVVYGLGNTNARQKKIILACNQGNAKQ